MAKSQRTIADAVDIEGAGLHSGAPARLRILPAEPDAGISFVRRDLGGITIPAAHRYLQDSSYATTLGRDSAAVATVEHLLSALHGVGIDNATIEVDGPEIPILDGSALPFVEAMHAAGRRRQRARRRYLGLQTPISIRRGDRTILALPSNELRITYAIDFPHSAIGYQVWSARLDRSSFATAIAPARTFCLLRDVEAMQKAGLALGGSLDNAVVVGDDGVLNESLRFPDECVRHKVLDLIGDLALLGMPLRAHVIAFKGGHGTHAELVGALLASRGAWTLRSSDERLPREQVARFAHLTEQILPRQPALSV
ncbi:MAG TPA: UDP-3-O-acyl-N-acetylglucosamine deacetylase [Candidatus Polarisedimenticolia bacterium]|nr:UDP-3-O-acyl-N-acetylglucosamine deacetylase [Candidatus Polarisedimenticolia bacterium]